jgi:hypothetical protein
VFVAEQPTGPTAGSDVAAQLHDLQAVVANLVERVQRLESTPGAS